MSNVCRIGLPTDLWARRFGQFRRAISTLAVRSVFGLCALGLAFTAGILALSVALPAWGAALILFAFARLVAGMGVARPVAFTSNLKKQRNHRERVRNG